MPNEKTLEELAVEERRAYRKKHYRKNRNKIAAKQREWREANPDKVRKYNQNYWLKKAQEKQMQ